MVKEVVAGGPCDDNNAVIPGDVLLKIGEIAVDRIPARELDAASAAAAPGITLSLRRGGNHFMYVIPSSNVRDPPVSQPSPSTPLQELVALASPKSDPQLEPDVIVSSNTAAVDEARLLPKRFAQVTESSNEQLKLQQPDAERPAVAATVAEPAVRSADSNPSPAAARFDLADIFVSAPAALTYAKSEASASAFDIPEDVVQRRLRSSNIAFPANYIYGADEDEELDELRRWKQSLFRRPRHEAARGTVGDYEDFYKSSRFGSILGSVPASYRPVDPVPAPISQPRSLATRVTDEPDVDLFVSRPLRPYAVERFEPIEFADVDPAHAASLTQNYSVRDSQDMSPIAPFALVEGADIFGASTVQELDESFIFAPEPAHEPSGSSDAGIVGVQVMC
jgi:hypothetical protein